MASQDKINSSHSFIKQQLLARAHSVNSDVKPGLSTTPDVAHTTPEPETSQTNSPKPIKYCTPQKQQKAPTPIRSSTPQQQDQPSIIKYTKKLTGTLVLDKVMAMDDSAVSSLDTGTKSDSHSLFSSQE